VIIHNNQSVVTIEEFDVAVEHLHLRVAHQFDNVEHFALTQDMHKADGWVVKSGYDVVSGQRVLHLVNDPANELPVIAFAQVEIERYLFDSSENSGPPAILRKVS
jgi:hypothetical protein